MIKALALYLPQFHPIPENDAWWGKGFTEWTNVTKAKPLYKGHFQPRLPADLGFYDLRVPETREAQANLAKEYGVYGFCYWHYWFGGRRIIERPFTEVVKSGKPDFPFCIAWANQTWSGTWHGLSNKKILIEQTYSGANDYRNHFYAMLESFCDKRYIEVDGRKLVLVFRPMDIPDPVQFIDIWNELAVKEGLTGFHFVGMNMPADWNPMTNGYQASVELGPQLHTLKEPTIWDKIAHRFFNANLEDVKRKRLQLPVIVDYANYVKQYPDHTLMPYEYPMIYPGWDNTPRSGANGWVFEHATPELFYELCIRGFKATANKSQTEKIVILKSWNEWAEGNYLEPDRAFGHQYLQSFGKALADFKRSAGAPLFSS